MLLIDARKGLLTQTKRHSRIVSMLGIRHVTLAVNKMDLVDWSQPVFDEIALAYRCFAEYLDFETITAIPLSALEGHNIVDLGHAAMPWYEGPSLLRWLETVPIKNNTPAQPFAMSVQWVNRRPNFNFRGFSGRIASGSVMPGDSVRVSPSGVTSRIKEIVVWNGPKPQASAGESVTLVLEDEVDASRGDVIADAFHPVESADQFEADLLWMSEHALLPGRPYAALIHTKSASVTITHIKHRLDINSGARLSAKTLGLNEIATVNVSFDRPVPFTPYRRKRLGAFIVIDKLTNETVGAALIRFALRRSANVHWQVLEVTKIARAVIKHQQPRCLWFTGLSGSGKSTIANLLEKRLYVEGKHTYILDGDNIRHGLNRDLGFTEADRVENVRRIAEVARLLVDAGLIVVVAIYFTISSRASIRAQPL